MRLQFLHQIVLSRKDVRETDRIAIERFGISGVVLMENAGLAAAREVVSLLNGQGLLPDNDHRGRVCILAGTGNNAGDGFVIARHLYNQGVIVEVILCGPRARITGDAAANLAIIEKMGLPIIASEPADAATITGLIRHHATESDILVDALLGTGTAGPPREPIRSAIEVINASNKPVLAIDIPSGLDCDTGEPLEIAVRAVRTVTFAANKKGFLNPAAAVYTGEVIVASIGVHTALLTADSHHK